jgi:hypothetical protein
MDFLVDRADLRRCKFVSAPGPDDIELQPGQVLVEVAKFGFTSNNITYGAFGEAMNYWAFFPAPDGWGRIPVWGFGDVIRSNHDAIPERERIFGYLPMSTHLIVQPEKVTEAGFVDGSPHRSALPATYQQYTRVKGDPGYDEAYEDQQAIFRPLFMTSFLIDDFLAENDFFGASAVLLASASSKTALGVAFLLSRRQGARCEVIALTSPSNVEFCERLGYYDRVLTYEAVRSLPPDTPTVLVDMAGDGELLHAVHTQLGDSLQHSCIVGATHWEARSTEGDLPGPTPEFFFAPTRVEKRLHDWGSDELAKRYGEANGAFLPSVERWMKITYGRGPAAVEDTYRQMLEGQMKPEEGHILALGG